MAEKHATAFEKALTQAVLSRYQTQLDADTEPVQLSDEYRAAIAALTKKTERKSWKFVNTTFKRLLIAAIIVALLAATAFAVVPIFREKPVEYTMRSDGIKYSFTFSQEDYDRAPKEIETRYEPSYMPEGYSLHVKNNDLASSDIHFISNSRSLISFCQHILWQPDPDYVDSPDTISVYGINSEGAEIETVVINGYEVKLLHYTLDTGEKTLSAVWTNHEYFFDLSLDFDDADIAARIIESIQPVD